jgi:hypothetical protein
LVLDVKRFILLEWGIDQEPERASGLQHGAVARVLRQERPLIFAARSHADARAN